MVIDPGLVSGRDAILRPLAELELAPEQITDVVLSHHHPDHTLNAALFPNARVHDHWAWYRDDLWIDRPAEGFELSSSIRLIETPGHSPQDVSTLVDTDGGLVVFTHLWWTATVPDEDPFAPDPARAPREPRPRALAAGAAHDRSGPRGAVRAGAGHAPLANAQARPSAAAIAAMSSGVVPQHPPISDAPASFHASGRSGGRASCRGGSVHALRIGSQNEPRFG